MPRLAEGGLDGILDSQAAAGQAWQRQLIQIARVDRLVGTLRRRAVAAGGLGQGDGRDHQRPRASFRSGVNRRTIVKENAASIAFAPLFIKYPGQTGGGPVPTRTQEVDLLPTIAEVTGIEAYPGRDGMPISQITDPWRPANVDGLEFGRGLLERRLESDLSSSGGCWGPGASGRWAPRPGLIGRKIPATKLLRTGRARPAASTTARQLAGSSAGRSGSRR